MASEDSKASELNGIQVCVRVRPLNDRERDAGYRNCISFDEATQQVVLSAVDRNTLLQLRGQTAKGYAFDRRYGPEHTSDNIFDDCVCQLVDNLFKGYNGTVLAYGQTGSGKTLTMSGGQGIYGNVEKGIIRQAAEQILRNVQAVRSKQKPGESIAVKAYALELYNEELRDLSNNAAGAASQQAATDTEGGRGESAVRIAERPYGRDGKCIPEVVGVNVVEVQDAESLVNFFAECFDNRAVGATKLNDRSSRSHAIYTVLISRTLVDVSEGDSKVRTERVESRFNLVDLAGSERVKRSGVTGAAFKEAVHINSGLLALGNVIVALSGLQEEEDLREGLGERPGSPSKSGARKHIPYRDSKLTRLLQDSLGGTALTILISCISSCEADFEETNSTLKYANRACKIKNMPLQNKQLLLEEDLLPLLPANTPQTGNMCMMQMQLLLTEHNRMKEAAERREKEKKEKEEKRLAELRALKESQSSSPGYQRLRMAQYDELRKKLVSSHGKNIGRGEMIQDDSLTGFRKHGGSDGEASDDSRPNSARSARESRPSTSARPHSARVYLNNYRPRGGSPTKPWTSTEGSRSGTPDVLVVEAEDEGQDSGIAAAVETGAMAGVSRESRMANRPERQRPESADADVPQTASMHEAAGRQVPARELHDMCLGTDSEAAVAGADLKVAVVEAVQASKKAETCTCITPHADSINAFYDPNTANTPISQSAVHAGTNSAAAFSVLAFQQQQQPDVYPEQPPAPAAAPIPPPQLLARFKVNQHDTLAVFKAVSIEDFADVAGLLPPNTALPAADKMTYLLARLEVHPYSNDQLAAALDSVASGACGIGEAVGPAVGCLMATFGTSLITDCIFDFEDPEQLQDTGLQQRLELWGLQIPHTPIRPILQPDDSLSGANTTNPGSAADANHRARVSSPDVASSRRSSTSAQSICQAYQSTARRSSLHSGNNSQLTSNQGLSPQQQPEQQLQQTTDSVTCWSSMDRLNVSIGLMYALCNLALEVGAVAGFCVPRPQLLRRWLQSGVKMRQVSSPTKLIYPPSAHDYSYYKSSTVAYFLIDEVRESLTRVLSNAQQVSQQQEVP